MLTPFGHRVASAMGVSRHVAEGGSSMPANPCSIEHCDSPARARTWCNRHWLRWRRHGHPLGGGSNHVSSDTSLADRFWPRVAIIPGQCWEWDAARDSAGYGVLNIGHSVTERAHVVSFILHNGKRPAGMMVLHHCDNPPCVRPDHLYGGTAKDNTRDMIKRGRAAPQIGRVYEWVQRKRAAEVVQR